MIGSQREAEESAARSREDADEESDDERVDTKELATRAEFGKRFVESTAFRNYRGAGTSERLTLPGPASQEFRAAITTGTVGLTNYTGPLPQFWGGNNGPSFVNAFLNLIGRVATSQSAVMYLTWEPQPPGNAPIVAEGDLKPEAVMDAIEKTIALSTFAHYKAVTRQALEDIPQVQTIIQNRLLAGVSSALENAAVSALVAAVLTAVDGAGSLVAGIREAIAEVESKGFKPTAVLMNPSDAATLDMEAMSATVNGAVRTGSVWGLPVVTSPAVAAGTAYVGDFKNGQTWFDRGTTDVYMSDSHADFFLRNQLVILAEARAAFAVTEVSALCEATAGVPPVIP
jgi:HK97 family phage major capsid protein